ncbi:MAG: hypothetical protein Q8L34_01805 [Candidatus Woesearchaeota archaeon]|nr:hypothetical protein [Candidatus Woesearchaeota archaeon]
MDFKIFIKILARLSGSLLLSTGIFLIIFAFISSNVVNNIDKIDDTAKEVSVPFLTENRAEIRTELAKSYANEPLITKEQALVVCSNPEQISDEFKLLLNPDFCSKLNSMTEEEVRTYFMNYLIDASVDKLVEFTYSEQSLKPIKDTINAYGAQEVKSSGLIIGLFLYLIGVFLFSFGSNFHLIYGLYGVSIRTTMMLASSAFVFLIIRFVPAENFLALIEWMRNVASVNIQEVPSVLLKFIVTIALAWIRLSITPVLIGILVVLVPFTGLSIFLYTKKKKLEDEVKTEELNKNTSPDNSKKVEKKETKK